MASVRPPSACFPLPRHGAWLRRGPGHRQPWGPVSQGWEGDSQVGSGSCLSPVGLKEYECPRSPPFLAPSRFDKGNFCKHSGALRSSEESERPISCPVCQTQPRPHGGRQEMPCYTPAREKGRGTWPQAGATSCVPTSARAPSLPRLFSILSPFSSTLISGN